MNLFKRKKTFDDEYIRLKSKTIAALNGSSLKLDLFDYAPNHFGNIIATIIYGNLVIRIICDKGDAFCEFTSKEFPEGWTDLRITMIIFKIYTESFPNDFFELINLITKNEKKIVDTLGTLSEQEFAIIRCKVKHFAKKHSTFK